MTETPTPTGPEIIYGIAGNQSMDAFMRRDPANVTPDKRRLLIETLRLERAQWILKGEKKAKKDTDNDD